MQLELGFFEARTPDQAATVWPTLDQRARVEVVHALARLVAKAAADHGEHAADEEKDNE